jgi:hypothetical protein
MPITLMGLITTRRISNDHVGMLAGSLPAPAPDSPDGRLKKLNVPAIGRIAVLERSTMRPVAMTRSAPDGTWRVDNLDVRLKYTVIGFDDEGLVNAAVQDWITPHVPEP